MNADDTCGECGASLSADAKTQGLCERCLVRLALDVPKAESGDGATATVSGSTEHAEYVGPYRLLQKLGEGGMGEVWLAEQTEPVRRKVALKVIKQGLDTKQVLARFEAERQALAMMDHPAIAKVYDAGATPQGRPYFAMEYVDGVPITEHCDRHMLTNQERLELFLRVCEGVQHAHLKAVIHRDLKPSNVLVSIRDDKALPKIIDFGVAKSTAQKLTAQTMHTQLGVMIGTPAYMSPEQAELTGHDVDTRTDVYALGVMLYELLVGALPFDMKELAQAGLEAVVRRIREDEPPRPSMRLSTLGDESKQSAERRRTQLPALRRELAGDLDWITLKALEKDLTRRYSSPQELAADIGCYLRHEPVLASPPSAAYRAKKFVQRHSWGVGAAAAGVVLLIAFGATMAVQAKRIASERDAAERAKLDLEEVVEFQTGMLSATDPEEMGRRLMADLEMQVEEVRRVRGQTEEEVAAALSTLDEVVAGVNATNLALRVIDEDILGQAVRTLEERFADRPELDARLRDTIGNSYRKLGRYERAELQLESALATRKRVLGEEHPDTLTSMTDLAGLYDDQSRYTEAEPLYVTTLETQTRVLGQEHPDTIYSMTGLAYLYWHQSRYTEAEPLLAATLEARKSVLGEEHPDTLDSMNLLARLYHKQSRYAEAEPLYVTTIETKKRVLGEEHPSTLGAMNNLGNLYNTRGRYAESEQLLVATLETRTRVLGKEHPDTLHSVHNLANLYNSQGRYAEAEPLYLATLEKRKRVLGEEHADTLYCILNLANLYRKQGRYAEAEPLFVAMVEKLKRVIGEEHRYTLLSMKLLANLYRKQGRHDEAQYLVSASLEAMKKRAEARTDAGASNAYARLALTCEPADLRDPESALEFALAANEQTDYANLNFLDTLALAYHRTGDTVKAIETQRRALSLLPADADRAAFETRLVEYEAALEE